MRKIIASINMTLNGYCDHNDGVADAALHDHYTDLIRHAGLLLYGRVTYQLMEGFWPGLVAKPSGERALDDFAVAIDDVQKIVYSRTLQEVSWRNTALRHEIDVAALRALKQQPGGDILVGSPGLITTLAKLQIIDEYQLCIHPVISGSGPELFAGVDKTNLQLLKTKVFDAGQVLLYYIPIL